MDDTRAFFPSAFCGGGTGQGPGGGHIVRGGLDPSCVTANPCVHVHATMHTHICTVCTHRMSHTCTCPQFHTRMHRNTPTMFVHAYTHSHTSTDMHTAEAGPVSKELSVNLRPLPAGVTATSVPSAPLWGPGFSSRHDTTWRDPAHLPSPNPAAHPVGSAPVPCSSPGWKGAPTAVPHTSYSEFQHPLLWA